MSEWKRVNESLPQKSGEYLVTVGKHKSLRFVTVLYFTKDLYIHDETIFERRKGESAFLYRTKGHERIVTDVVAWKELELPYMDY